MVKVRGPMWETNSSSTHSIIVGGEVPEVAPVAITFDLGSYGWGFQALETIGERAAYFYTAACLVKGYDVFPEIEALLRPFGIAAKRDWTQIPNWHVMKHGDSEWKYLTNGDIDHSGDPELAAFVEKCMGEGDYLVKYLLGSHSRVITGNDNSDEEPFEWFEEHSQLEDGDEEWYKGN